MITTDQNGLPAQYYSNSSTIGYLWHLSDTYSRASLITIVKPHWELTVLEWETASDADGMNLNFSTAFS